MLNTIIVTLGGLVICALFCAVFDFFDMLDNSVEYDRSCRNCEWHDGFTWFCFNDESGRKTHFTDIEYSCDKWKGKNDD